SFFSFQAEDGIRDRNVTGVQTCALPIYLVAAVQLELGAQRLEQQLGEAVGVAEGDAVPAPLAVDAHAELDLVVAERELGLGVPGVGAGGEGEAHGAGAGGGAATDRCDLREARPGLGGGAAELLDDHGGGGAAAAGAAPVGRVGGEVVVHQHHLGLHGVVAADLP